MKRKTIARLLIYGGVVAGFLIWRPYHDGCMRWGLPLVLAACWVGLVIALWKKPLPRAAAIVGPCLLLLPLALPGRDLDRARLREDYLAAMQAFDGCRYVWGGENARGIDCSGLPRRALRDALRHQAIRGNGRAARMWLAQWWFDTSARAMGEGYRGFTRPIGVEGPLWKLDPAELVAGDLAVTRGGSHVMVYLGGGSWIQADPGPGKVFIARADEDDNPWFRCEVSLHRWTVLE
ncbi:NlpC/P60 family protein [Luteolibacter marinus]|uniref:NlpC/P60 family protein n=1 Tax=Luteolibacter marinus TaxID=2776705 RepID=UPI0018669103|nr:NlpC/P60 family protein [Luteolibacter marinus]